jgi:hypothetical protein
MASLLALRPEDTPRAEVARRLGVKPPSLHGYEAAGADVQVSSLAKVAEALGFSLKISVVREK